MRDEYRLRQRLGDKPDLAEYRRRFPDRDQLLAELEIEASEKCQATPPVGERATWVENSQPEAAAEPSQERSTGTSFSMAARFKKVRKIGQGGFGEVWEARAPGGVPVAIKRIFGSVSPRAIAREKESLDLICSGRLRHPFLLQVFGWWIQDKKLHIAMELAEDGLEHRLKVAQDQGLTGLARDELRQVMVDAADALDFLNHGHSILHRDVKPANMLLMANRLKLCDFGLTRMTENLALASGRTMGAGTPVFIAPEIIRGFQSMNSDQYSLAASYYMLRTGKPIFSGRVQAIRQQHLSAEPQFDEGIISAVERQALARALKKEPQERFDTCAQFVAELLAESSGRPVIISKVEPISQAPAEAEPVVSSPAAPATTAEPDSEPPMPNAQLTAGIEQTAAEPAPPSSSPAGSLPESPCQSGVTDDPDAAADTSQPGDPEKTSFLSTLPSSQFPQTNLREGSTTEECSPPGTLSQAELTPAPSPTSTPRPASPEAPASTVPPTLDSHPALMRASSMASQGPTVNEPAPTTTGPGRIPSETGQPPRLRKPWERFAQSGDCGTPLFPALRADRRALRVWIAGLLGQVKTIGTNPLRVDTVPKVPRHCLRSC